VTDAAKQRILIRRLARASFHPRSLEEGFGREVQQEEAAY